MTDAEDLPCRELVELVTEHLEGTLDPVLEQRLREHLAVCTGCTDHVEQVRASVALAGALPADAVPERLLARLAELHQAHARPQP